LSAFFGKKVSIAVVPSNTEFDLGDEDYKNEKLMRSLNTFYSYVQFQFFLKKANISENACADFSNQVERIKLQLPSIDEQKIQQARDLLPKDCSLALGQTPKAKFEAQRTAWHQHLSFLSLYEIFAEAKIQAVIEREGLNEDECMKYDFSSIRNEVDKYIRDLGQVQELVINIDYKPL